MWTLAAQGQCQDRANAGADIQPQDTGRPTGQRKRGLVSLLFSDDFDIVLAGVKNKRHTHDISPLKYASFEMKNNYEIALAAVQTCGRDLQYTSKEMKNNRNIVLEAVQQDAFALKYASYRLQRDNEILLAAYGNYLKFCT